MFSANTLPWKEREEYEAKWQSRAFSGFISDSNAAHRAVLGVREGAAAAEIRSAYRKLALEFHPDKNPGARQRFDDIKDAFDAHWYGETVETVDTAETVETVGAATMLPRRGA